jgi:hypothetical protein
MMLLLHFGNMSKEQVTKNTTLFAREVMPHLRGLFNEWEDRWWINPLPPADRRVPNPASSDLPGVK